MDLRETLTRILSEYPTAETAPLEGHPLAQFIRGETEGAVVGALGSEADGLIVQGRCAIHLGKQSADASQYQPVNRRKSKSLRISASQHIDLLP
jgi:hypothetical protein